MKLLEPAAEELFAVYNLVRKHCCYKPRSTQTVIGSSIDMSLTSPEFDLRCPACLWIAVCGPPQMVEWLRAHRLVKSTGELETDVLVELFRTSADKFRCPQCGRTGLTATPAAAEDDEAWGQARKCESCGVIIPVERLEVFPEMRLCVNCQERDDSGELGGIAEYCPRCGSVMMLERSRGEGITRYVMRCPECGHGQR